MLLRLWIHINALEGNLMHVVSGRDIFRLFIVANSQKLMGAGKTFRARDQNKTLFSALEMNPNFEIQCWVGKASTEGRVWCTNVNSAFCSETHRKKFSTTPGGLYSKVCWGRRGETGTMQVFNVSTSLFYFKTETHSKNGVGVTQC